MPSRRDQHGRGLTTLLLLPLAALIACIYIGVPLLLFTHDFSHRLAADTAFAVVAFAAVLGGVLRGLRRTTRLAAPADGIGPVARSAAQAPPRVDAAEVVLRRAVAAGATIGD